MAIAASIALPPCFKIATPTLLASGCAETTAPLTPTICFGNSINLTAAVATNYTWSPNTAITSTVGANVTVNPTVTTTYQIIGEAARLLPDEIKQATPQVPWREISGMRNHLIHRYFKVAIDEVWRTTQNDLSPLKVVVEKILAGLN